MSDNKKLKNDEKLVTLASIRQLIQERIAELSKEIIKTDTDAWMVQVDGQNHDLDVSVLTNARIHTTAVAQRKALQELYDKIGACSHILI